mmetsp:Transcript_18251/g.28865  ORF Transcript_18251/g.28865 Transcript_18251/m.28865 type:complete len:278 (+) Transcript_18251:94-927(+)
MALFARRQLQRGGKHSRVDHQPCVAERFVIQPRAAFGDQTFGLFARACQAGFHDQLYDADPVPDLFAAQGQGGQVLAHTALFEHVTRSGGGGGRRVGPMQQGGDFGGQPRLGFVDLRALQSTQPIALVQWHFGIKLEEPTHIRIGRVAPELPEFIGRQHLGVQPDRTSLRLAHFFAVRRGQQRRGEAVDLPLDHPARQVDAVDDIAPLIRTTHLQDTVIAAVKLHEIIGLQDHIVEFEKAKRLFAVQPGFDAFKAEHPVDREMPPNVAQEIEVVQPV